MRCKLSETKIIRLPRATAKRDLVHSSNKVNTNCSKHIKESYLKSISERSEEPFRDSVESTKGKPKNNRYSENRRSKKQAPKPATRDNEVEDISPRRPYKSVTHKGMQSSMRIINQSKHLELFKDRVKGKRVVNASMEERVNGMNVNGGIMRNSLEKSINDPFREINPLLMSQEMDSPTKGIVHC
eukprot:TRINITY_DN8757_c0_g7_i2.p1 TRINITY_DN8757_c0_g7~~TRINITY_DN8757_c0_g7_i2.p1  ORF type:complete len:185 (-),score=18.92 TRINITY_DN8757_c0_g7_i2:400-954(-)